MATEQWTPVDGVREYGDEMTVYLSHHCGRLVVIAQCECGWNHTAVDLLDLLAWVKERKPELLEEV